MSKPYFSNLYVVLNYLVTWFAWPTIQEFHAAVLLEIECDCACWDDLLTHVDFCTQRLNLLVTQVLPASLALCYFAVIFKATKECTVKIIMG